jgi:hypothetical protein
MKKYINSESQKAHFIGEVPEGWREMTTEELQQEEVLSKGKQMEEKIRLLKEKKLEELLLADINTPKDVKEYLK